jgi:hypothetical protein
LVHRCFSSVSIREENLVSADELMIGVVFSMNESLFYAPGSPSNQKLSANEDDIIRVIKLADWQARRAVE